MDAKKKELDPKTAELEEITMLFLNKKIACLKRILKICEAEMVEQEDLRELLRLFIESIQINVDFMFEFILVEKGLRESNVSDEE